MNRHERCQATIQNRPTDRAPTYLTAISCEVASKILGRRAYTGTGSLRYAEVLAWARGEQAHAEFEAQLMQDLLDIHRALDIDVIRTPWRMNARPTKQLDDYTFLFGDPEGAHAIYQYHPESADFDVIKEVALPEPPEDLLRKLVETLEAGLDKELTQTPAWWTDHLALDRQSGREFFLVAGAGAISVGLSPDAMMMLAMEPDLSRRLMMIQARRAVQAGELLVKSSCPKVMLGGGDLAGNTGPVYSPEMFRQVMLPAYQFALDHLNARGIHYVFRTDGNLWPLMDMLFAQARCPGYGETDRGATMTVAAIRRRFPNLVIWGNMPSQLLQQGTSCQVRDEAKRILDESGGRGYFQGCSNAILIGTPPENVFAMFETR